MPCMYATLPQGITRTVGIQVIPEAAVEAAKRFVVYGGNGRRRLGWLQTRKEAEQFAADFERKCWSQGVAVPRSWIEEEV